MIHVKMLADSVSPNGHRLSTLECTFPRCILAEVNTHRAFSRNSASSRAIPVEKMIASVMDNPFVPLVFPINRPGMSASEYVEPGDDLYNTLRLDWLAARNNAVASARSMLKHNIHKQQVNRLLEPFMWHTAIISATEWDSFFALRCDKATTEPHFWRLAMMMSIALAASKPQPLWYGEWHLPLVTPNWADRANDRSVEELIQMSVARVAAVSFNRQHVEDPQKEFDRYELLRGHTHLSPFEHIATPSNLSYNTANFRGWKQHRYDIEMEAMREKRYNES